VRVALDYDPALRSRGGGVARYVKQLVPRLLEEDPGLELYLVGSRAQGMPVHPRVHAVAHGLSARAWRLRLLVALATNRSLGGLLPRVDVFHATDYVFPPEGPDVGRVVVTIHDVSVVTHPATHTWLNRASLRLFMEVLRRKRYHVITPSQAVSRELSQQLGYPGSLITVIPHGATEC
jgi:glycosyltransferase involved in cell wall biosynthesis